MRILKSTKVLECTCAGCKSVLEVEPQDVQTSEVAHPFGAWFICPVCGKRNSLDGKIPKDWYATVYKDEQI